MSRLLCLIKGSFNSATCLTCGDKMSGKLIESEIFDKTVAYCRKCPGLIKPDITFFGEPVTFH
jgi:NAD-dependent SIR2 family protein deacetylase